MEAFDPKQAVARILAEHGPLHEHDIAQRLQDAGIADPDTVLGEVLDEMVSPARQLLDERWVWLPTVLAGRVFTHRLGAHETTYDIVTVTADLDPITTICEHEEYARFVDGSAARTVLAGYDNELIDERGIPDEVVDEHPALLLIPGTLESLGVAEGDLIGVRLTAEGLEVQRVNAGTLSSDATVAACLVASVNADDPVFLDEVIWTACVEDPTAFTEPLSPISEIVDSNGLAHDGDWLAAGGFDFESWRFENRCAALAHRHDLDPDDALALFALLNAFNKMSQLVGAVSTDEAPHDAIDAADNGPIEPDGADSDAEGFADLVGEVGAALADPLLAELLVAETVGTGPRGPATLGLFADVLEPKVPQAARVACRWLRAVALQRIGDIDAAEHELLVAESMDPNWPLSLLDLARIASDRGDADRGLALLRRAGAEPDHPLIEILTQYRAEPRRDIGRNQACWCGSGLKYKKCHLGREQLPLSERAGWLYAKASQHVLLTAWDELLAEVGYERARYSDDSDDAFAEALSDPLVTDAVLFEGGAFEEFLEMRGSLLPEDERFLAEQWLLIERSVFEVEEVRRGQGVTVRDVRTGDTHEVREFAASRQLNVGQLVCARVVPAGDTMQFFGGLEPVALHERDQLIDLLDMEPDARTLVAQLSRRFAPPTLVNTEGDPLAICEATVHVGDPARIAAALDDIYDRVDDDESPRWIEQVTTQGMLRVRSTLVLDGHTLQVQANSDKRMDRVLATLARLDPAMTVLDDVRRPLRDTREAAELAKQLPSAGEDALDLDDPELAAMLEKFIRDFETKWLDESIPALDGVTPRQAADDPTRRGDLIRLLDTFPAGAAARGGMDADRLRAALGLR